MFALAPEAAAQVVYQIAQGYAVDFNLQEVRDIDEQALREGRLNSRFYAELWVPAMNDFIQQVKMGGGDPDELALEDMAAYVVEQMQPGRLYLIGPGSTPAVVMAQLGLANTLLGVDAVVDQRLLAADLNAEQLLALVQKYDEPVALVTPTGGQGFLLGRGNQQLSAAVLAEMDKDDLWVMATPAKLGKLQGRPLMVDLNDALQEKRFSGYHTVITGYQRQLLYPIMAPRFCQPSE